MWYLPCLTLPLSLKPGIFTSAAVDNLDHNLSSATAQSSFHGTTISIFQHPAIPTNRNIFKLEASTSRSEKMNLPDIYIDIKPTRSVKPEPPNVLTNQAHLPSTESMLSIQERASPWLKKIIYHTR